MAFYGIAGYAYGVIAINLGGGNWTFPAAVAALVVAMGAAWLFGYFVFYGRVSGWIVPVLTLALLRIPVDISRGVLGRSWLVQTAVAIGVLPLFYSVVRDFVRSRVVATTLLWVGVPLLAQLPLVETLRAGSDEGKPILDEYGGMSKASVGVLLRAIVVLEQEGADIFFGEPEFDPDDLVPLDGKQDCRDSLRATDVEHASGGEVLDAPVDARAGDPARTPRAAARHATIRSRDRARRRGHSATRSLPRRALPGR